MPKGIEVGSVGISKEGFEGWPILMAGDRGVFIDLVAALHQARVAKRSLAKACNDKTRGDYDTGRN